MEYSKNKNIEKISKTTTGQKNIQKWTSDIYKGFRTQYHDSFKMILNDLKSLKMKK